LNFEDIQTVTNKPLETSSFDVEVAFEQLGVTRKIMDAILFDAPFTTNLRPTSIRLTFKLPKISNPFSKCLYYVIAIAKRRKVLYEIDALPTSFLNPSDIAEERGQIVFETAREIRGHIHFVYRFIGKISIPSVFLGAILTIIIGVIVKLIVDVIYNMLGKG
jgi:hypothetical protein